MLTFANVGKGIRVDLFFDTSEGGHLGCYNFCKYQILIKFWHTELHMIKTCLRLPLLHKIPLEQHIMSMVVKPSTTKLTCREVSTT